jgi:3-isopropylmalate/(R)-2-methylmalate dehydratase small subunit
MRPVAVVTGRAVPLERSDVDTDQIIPSDWLKRVERTGFGRGLFSAWRDDRSFVLNDERYAGASILVAGENFGTGSSREHAVWALLDFGFEAVISPRFADIFFSNCTKQGLVPVTLGADEVRELMDAVASKPELEVTIDVVRRSVEVPAIGFVASFTLDEFTAERFVNGWDDISLTLLHEGDLERFEAARSVALPGTERRAPAG